MNRTFPKFGYNPVTGEWNDSLKGDYCWSGVNFREAAPDVMTPSTWSSLWVYLNITFPVHVPGEHLVGGNIAGRIYFNLSVITSLFHAVGLDSRKEWFGDLLGSLPANMGIPYLPFSAPSVVWNTLPGIIKDRARTLRDRHQFREYITHLPEWCRVMRARIDQCANTGTLLDLWKESILPARLRSLRMLRSMTVLMSGSATRLNLDLTALVGQTEARALLSNLSGASGDLECLGPLIGLAKVKDGRMSREEYQDRYGHRGPHEVELSAPRSDEDPDWLEKRLAVFSQSGTDVEALLAKQRAEFEAAWQRFMKRSPEKAGTFRHRLERVAAAEKDREAVRSGSIRMSRVIREFLLKVGDVTGTGDDIFFLTLDEVAQFLSGDRLPLSCIPARRAMHRRYCALPPYPAIIYGRFDPFKWAADPNRRSDFYDARQPAAAGTAAASTIKGFAGAAGCVEGTVRRVERVEEGGQIQPGEILVTSITNIGWTPFFPRLAAIVTDIGAPLSHAAIVARELGIPAVVGCGNATMLLTTGDRIRVDGEHGVVEILSGDNARPERR